MKIEKQTRIEYKKKYLTELIAKTHDILKFLKRY